MTTRRVSAELPADAGSAADARGFIFDTLTEWECADLVDVVSLLASELVTNSVLHARTEMTISLALDGRRLRVEVCDHSQQMPQIRPYDVDTATGRGLAMVAGYASAWGAEARPDGKAVWFEVDA